MCNSTKVWRDLQIVTVCIRFELKADIIYNIRGCLLHIYVVSDSVVLINPQQELGFVYERSSTSFHVLEPSQMMNMMDLNLKFDTAQHSGELSSVTRYWISIQRLLLYD